MKSAVTGLMLALASAAHAQEAPSPIFGEWILSPESQRGFSAACRDMALKFTAEGKAVRTTGALIYTTAVKLKSEGSGWLLSETLESDNGQPACSGKQANQVLEHLDRQAYVEIEPDQLRYYRKFGDKRFIHFIRIGT